MEQSSRSVWPRREVHMQNSSSQHACHEDAATSTNDLRQPATPSSGAGGVRTSSASTSFGGSTSSASTATGNNTVFRSTCTSICTTSTSGSTLHPPPSQSQLQLQPSVNASPNVTASPNNTRTSASVTSSAANTNSNSNSNSNVNNVAHLKIDFSKPFLFSDVQLKVPEITPSPPQTASASDWEVEVSSGVDGRVILPDEEELRVASSSFFPATHEPPHVNNYRVFHSHRAVLSIWSPVFKAMFTNPDYKESSSPEIIIRDVDPSAFQLLMSYIYSAGEGKFDIDQGLEMLPIAHRYQISDLVDKIEYKMIGNLTDTSAISYLHLSDVYGLEKLKTTAADRASRIDLSKINAKFEEVGRGSMSILHIENDILRRRITLLEDCITNIHRSFHYPCVRMEVRQERAPANHCSAHQKPFTHTAHGDYCKDCINALNKHILELCRRSLHKSSTTLHKENSALAT